jgi:hypothetical protein
LVELRAEEKKENETKNRWSEQEKAIASEPTRAKKGLPVQERDPFAPRRLRMMVFMAELKVSSAVQSNAKARGKFR